MPCKTKVGEIRLNLPVEEAYKKRTKLWVICIPTLDLCAQGSEKAEARKNLREVSSLFFETCFENGTLFEVLKDSGLSQKSINVTATTARDDGYIDIAIPLDFGRRSGRKAMN
jgi:predicted RNase H-like HicB family nuclease